MRIAIILYCLLSAIINVSAAENVTPGKYLCVGERDISKNSTRARPGSNAESSFGLRDLGYRGTPPAL